MHTAGEVPRGGLSPAPAVPDDDNITLMEPFWHKRIRLDARLYTDPGNTASLTIGTKNRRRVFADPACAATSVDVLVTHARATRVALYAFCIMPDHVHLIVSPSAACDIVTFAGQFKNLAQHALWQLGVGGTIW